MFKILWNSKPQRTRLVEINGKDTMHKAHKWGRRSNNKDKKTSHFGTTRFWLGGTPHVFEENSVQEVSKNSPGRVSRHKRGIRI